MDVVDERHPAAQAVHDLAQRRQRQAAPALGVEQTAPGVEQLQRLRAGLDLAAEVGERGVGDAVEQQREPFRVAVAPRQEMLEVTRAAAFHEIGRERPGSAAEADHRDLLRQLAPHQPERGEDVAQRLLDVRQAQSRDVLAPPHRTRERRAVAAHELQLGAHRFEWQQDVGEQDGGVDAQACDGLQRRLGGELGSLAESQEIDPLPQRAILREIAAGLAHDPHRPALGRLAPAGPQEEVVHRARIADRSATPRRRANGYPPMLAARPFSYSLAAEITA